LPEVNSAKIQESYNKQTAKRMKDKYKYNTSQLFNFTQDSYLERTSRPIYAVVFLLPFIVFYELGTILSRTDVLSRYWQGRVVAFSWLQEALEYLGFGSKFVGGNSFGGCDYFDSSAIDVAQAVAFLVW